MRKYVSSGKLSLASRNDSEMAGDILLLPKGRMFPSLPRRHQVRWKKTQGTSALKAICLEHNCTVILFRITTH